MSEAVRIVIFAKAPEAGRVKTRLIPALGAQGAARLARRMLDHALQQALAADVGAVALCMSPGPDDGAWQGVELPAGVLRCAQGEGDLGERMARAMRRTSAGDRTSGQSGTSKRHARGQPVLLMGADCPALTAGVIAQAARQLAHHDAVMIPVADGGYVLLGLRAECPALFSDMAWSTATVAAVTQQRLSVLDLSVWLGPMLHDIDEPADLAHLPAAWHFYDKNGIIPASNGHSQLSVQ